MVRRTLATLVTLAALGAAAPLGAETESDAIRQRDDRIEELERKVDLLAGELSRVKSELVVPAEPTLESTYGFGPAASKVYGADRGLSIGGYGELNYRNFINDDDAAGDTLPGGTFSDSKLDRADALRVVLYLGYKLSLIHI